MSLHCNYYTLICYIFQAFHEASSTKTKPTALIAKTYKGKNFPTIEDQENWHGKPLGEKSEVVIQVSLLFEIYLSGTL